MKKQREKNQTNKIRNENGEITIDNDSSILAWRIPRTEGPGGLQSMGLQRVKT